MKVETYEAIIDALRYQMKGMRETINDLRELVDRKNEIIRRQRETTDKLIDNIEARRH